MYFLFKKKALTGEFKKQTEENKRLKKLGFCISDQRTTIETFFLETLEKIKLEIHKNKKTSNLMSLQKSKTSTSDINFRISKFEQDKVDIGDLTLEEKEKIYRILFHKINLGKKAPDWENLNNDKENLNDKNNSNQILS